VTPCAQRASRRRFMGCGAAIALIISCIVPPLLGCGGRPISWFRHQQLRSREINARLSRHLGVFDQTIAENGALIRYILRQRQAADQSNATGQSWPASKAASRKRRRQPHPASEPSLRATREVSASFTPPRHDPIRAGAGRSTMNRCWPCWSRARQAATLRRLVAARWRCRPACG
jgi:hypothetical protein